MQRVPDKEVIWLFVFAPTLANFIESGHREPEEHSRLIVTPPGSTLHEERAGIDPVPTQVAFLYARENTLTEKRRISPTTTTPDTAIQSFFPRWRFQENMRFPQLLPAKPWPLFRPEDLHRLSCSPRGHGTRLFGVNG